LTPSYCGRFAPSPTGPLHFGSLVTALASFLDARHHSGRWLLRIEDIDPPREVAGAVESIPHSLRRHGLLWDGPALLQSSRSGAYLEALQSLDRAGKLFRCTCSRQMLGANGVCIRDCRTRVAPAGEHAALRISVTRGTTIPFHDRVQGRQTEALGETTANFVVRRKDNLFAYQLAVAVDDGRQDITHVLRGADLLQSTPRQIYLMRCLGHPLPQYGHIPVATDAAGVKLSKQSFAEAVDPAAAACNLRRALAFLRQTPPPADLRTSREILDFAARHWNLAAVPSRHGIVADD